MIIGPRVPITCRGILYTHIYSTVVTGHHGDSTTDHHASKLLYIFATSAAWPRHSGPWLSTALLKSLMKPQAATTKLTLACVEGTESKIPRPSCHPIAPERPRPEQTGAASKPPDVHWLDALRTIESSNATHRSLLCRGKIALGSLTCMLPNALRVEGVADEDETFAVWVGRESQRRSSIVTCNSSERSDRSGIFMCDICLAVSFHADRKIWNTFEVAIHWAGNATRRLFSLWTSKRPPHFMPT